MQVEFEYCKWKIYIQEKIASKILRRSSHSGTSSPFAVHVFIAYWSKSNESFEREARLNEV